MTCDELELLLPDEAQDAAAQAHLAGCARCRNSAAVLSAAAQPPLSSEERAKQVTFATTVQSQWLRHQRVRTTTRSFVGLAVAASLGALVASGVMWKLSAPVPQPSSPMRQQPEVLVMLEDSAPPAADDESSFEVSWPTLNEEGDVL